MPAAQVIDLGRVFWQAEIGTGLHVRYRSRLLAREIRADCVQVHIVDGEGRENIDVLLRGKSASKHRIYREFRVTGQLFRKAIEYTFFDSRASIGRFRDFYGVLRHNRLDRHDLDPCRLP